MESDIIIRRAETGDLDELCSLERGNGALVYSVETLKSLLEDDSVVLVAETAARRAQSAVSSGVSAEKARGAIVGYVAVSIVFEDADVINIAVENEWRRCGIGRILMSEASRECVRQGAKRMLLEVSEDNASAISFYRGLGFEQIFLRPKYYGELSAIIMQLSLPDTSD